MLRGKNSCIGDLIEGEGLHMIGWKVSATEWGRPIDASGWVAFQLEKRGSYQLPRPPRVTRYWRMWRHASWPCIRGHTRHTWIRYTLTATHAGVHQGSVGGGTLYCNAALWVRLHMSRMWSVSSETHHRPPSHSLPQCSVLLDVTVCHSTVSPTRRHSSPNCAPLDAIYKTAWSPLMSI